MTVFILVHSGREGSNDRDIIIILVSHINALKLMYRIIRRINWFISYLDWF